MSRRMMRVLPIVLMSGLAFMPAATAGPGPAEACYDCHGRDGASTEPDVPIIGGLSEAYLTDSMMAYRDKERPCPESKYRAGDKSRPATDMCRIAAALSKAEIGNISKHLAAEPFVRAKQKADPQKAAAGKKIHEAQCERCHEDGGSSAADDAGILAGQWMKYLELSFQQYTDGSRPMPEKMKPRFEKLTPAEKEALIHFYGSFQ
jgi:cytochrome subunit of sulfide dehydrogenase